MNNVENNLDNQNDNETSAAVFVKLADKEFTIDKDTINRTDGRYEIDYDTSGKPDNLGTFKDLRKIVETGFNFSMPDIVDGLDDLTLMLNKLKVSVDKLTSDMTGEATLNLDVVANKVIDFQIFKFEVVKINLNLHKEIGNK